MADADDFVAAIGDEPPHTQSRHARLQTTFAARFGIAPSHIVRSPGRVNLIGEHIDYSGYAVLPMALTHDTMVAVCEIATTDATATATLTIAHRESARFDATTVPLTTQGLHIDLAAHKWTDYVVAGYRGVTEGDAASVHSSTRGSGGSGNSSSSNGSGDTIAGSDSVIPHRSLLMLVDGDVPLAAGLSSSSSLVCASALATCAALGSVKSMSRTKLASVCIACERLVGTASGGMDQ
jgi:N-acetylgalactosamine kinase